MTSEFRGREGGQTIPQFCQQIVHKIRKKGEGFIPDADVIYGSPQKQQQICLLDLMFWTKLMQQVHPN